MRIAVLAANGRTGQQLSAQALARGHEVVALARRPGPSAPSLTWVTADASDAAALARAVRGADVVVSGLGLVAGSPPGLLSTAASALAEGPRVVWLAAFGTGRSAGVARLSAVINRVLASEIPDRVQADETLLAAGASVFHAGPLTNGPVSPGRHTVRLEAIPGRRWPRPVSRATVAAAMLDAAQDPDGAGGVLLPLS
ncbi:SDR family oxidoreductase [Kineosporia sp. J2-2]|uniref:SDR family oxidoreductase n=1 Tax=Kineosporia corallincola TaxID=2835133 RepID=A0ABS5TRF7_9ACTN|nr:NAD(P)-binding oxidoreductase [Kineosporia corallincola]MBT0773378.1 SDR family oxidoreductase [Kineosporia corallincola]